MRKIPTIPVKFSPKQPFICSICPMARHTRLPFPDRTTSSTKIFELLHVDLRGPYHTPTQNFFKYFLTMVDNFSRSTWTHLLSCKNNTFNAIKGLLSLIENQFNTSVKIIRSDNGLDFVNNENITFFQERVLFIRNAVHTHYNKMVWWKENINTCLKLQEHSFTTKLPIKYWGECILTANFIINRLHPII